MISFIINVKIKFNQFWYIILIMMPNIPPQYLANYVQISKHQHKVDYGDWTDQIYLTIIQHMQEWEVEVLDLDFNERRTIVKEISHIQFSNLASLMMFSNQIQSIEGLARVHMPHLQTLQLNNNNIHAVVGLRKAYWPSFSSLSIDRNYVRDAFTLTQGYFPKFESLSLYYLHGEEKNLFFQPCFMAKFSNKKFKLLQIRSSLLAFDRGIKEVLSQKWRKAAIK